MTSCCVASYRGDSSSSRNPWDSPDVSQSPPRWEIPARSPAEKLSNLLRTLHTVTGSHQGFPYNFIQFFLQNTIKHQHFFGRDFGRRFFIILDQIQI